MQALAQRLMDWTSPKKVLLALFAFVVLQVGFGLATTHPAVGRVVSAMPDTHLGYEGAGLVALIGKLADDGTAARLLYGFDMLNPVVGGAFFCLLLARLLVATGRRESGWQLLAVLPIVAGTLDILENLVVLTLLSLYPSESIANAWVPLSALSAAKWVLHTSGLVSIVVLAVSYARRRARGGRAARAA